MIQLSRNFSLEEFDCNDGIPVPSELVSSLTEFVQGSLQDIRDFCQAPVYITSGYRHTEYNDKVGGVPGSYHIYDLRPGYFAVDFRAQGWEILPLWRALRGLMILNVIDKGGLTPYPDQGFIHYDNRGYYTNWNRKVAP